MSDVACPVGSQPADDRLPGASPAPGPLDRLAPMAARAVGAAGAALALADGDRWTLAGLAGAAPDEGAVATLAERVRRARRPQRLAPARARGAAGWLATPLCAGEETIGVLAVHDAAERRWTAADVAALEDVAGVGAALLASRRAQEAAAAADARLAALVDSVDAIVWEADAATLRFRFVSAGADTILGYPVRRWLEEPDFWVGLLHPDDRDATIAACRASTEAGEDHALEYRVIAADGAVHWLRDLVRVVPDARGAPAWLRGVMVDLTAQRELQAQLHHAQRMDAVGRLASGIAHDFNNLLAAIQSTAELLRDDLPREQRAAREDVHEILKTCGRGAALTRQLLAFGRPRAGPVPLDVGAAVRDVEPMLRRLLRQGDLQLEVAGPPAAGPVRMDPTQLTQVVVNLVVNARDALAEHAPAEHAPAEHAPAGGRRRIAVRWGVETVGAAARARWPWLAAGPHVRLTVSDTGCGMPPEVAERACEPFFTTKPLGRGTGLGLATAYGVARAAGGALQLDSAPGRGTDVHLLLPVAAADGR